MSARLGALLYSVLLIYLVTLSCTPPYFAKNICNSLKILVPLRLYYANLHINHNPSRMLQPAFKTAKILAEKIDAYFRYIEGEYHLEEKSSGEQKIWDREPEPPILTGLILFLGFNSRKQFEDYEQNGQFADTVKRGRLRVEALYERKLHQQAPTGAIFALKSMGWTERSDDKLANTNTFKSITIEILETGPALAQCEQEVAL